VRQSRRASVSYPADSLSGGRASQGLALSNPEGPLMPTPNPASAPQSQQRFDSSRRLILTGTWTAHRRSLQVGHQSYTEVDQRNDKKSTTRQEPTNNHSATTPQPSRSTPLHKSAARANRGGFGNGESKHLRQARIALTAPVDQYGPEPCSGKQALVHERNQTLSLTREAKHSLEAVCTSKST
jgi:hypothetical protein